MVICRNALLLLWRVGNHGGTASPPIRGKRPPARPPRQAYSIHAPRNSRKVSKRPDRLEHKKKVDPRLGNRLQEHSGWGAIHEEFWIDVINKEHCDWNHEEEEEEDIHELAVELAFEAAMDADAFGEEDPNEVYRGVFEAEMARFEFEAPI